MHIPANLEMGNFLFEEKKLKLVLLLIFYIGMMHNFSVTFYRNSWRMNAFALDNLELAGTSTACCLVQNPCPHLIKTELGMCLKSWIF